MSVVTNHQYEPPKLPPEWTGDEKKFYTRLIDILDEIYSKYGRLSLTDLSPAVRKVISGMVDGTTFETAIEQLQDSIALKASQSTVDELGDQVSSNTAAITLVPGQITSAVTAIQVGGRNLITNSEAITLSAGSGNFVHTGLYYPLANNQQYTISFGSVVQTAGSAPAYLTLNGFCPADNVDFRVARVLISTERQSYTFTTPDDGRAYRLIIYHGVAGSATAGNAFTLNNVKLEIGNKATDWTPAPEDTDAAITATRSMITQTSSEIRAEVSGMQVGGRNWLLASDTQKSASTYAAIRYDLADGHPFVAGTKFCLRVWGTIGSDRANFTAFNSGGNGNTDYLGSLTDNGDGTHTLSGTWRVGTGNTHLLLYNPPRDGTSTTTVTKVKLEIGDKFTDWSPAPEDTSVPLSGMDNLYSTGDSVSGYLTAAGGVAIGTAENTDTTSDYIAVTPGETLTFQCWVTPLTGTAHYLWMGYGFFDSSKTWMSSPGRTAQNQGANTGTFQYRYITFTVPAGAAYIRISGRMYADGRMKLERNAEPTPYRDAAGEVANTSMTLNKNGFFVKTSGTVQIDADDPAKKGRIALGELMSLDYTGGLQAKDGSFANSLKVGGKQVMTEAEITAPIKVATSQPSGHNFLWVKPTSVTSASYSAYSAGSRDRTVHFGATNPITRSFTADTTATLANATFTYTLDFDVYCLTDLSQVTNVKFTAVATKGSASVSFGASAAMTMTKYTLAHVTLTASSSTNLCTNSNAISVAITASASSLTKLFIQSDQYMTLKISNQAGSGTQTCSVYYVN